MNTARNLPALTACTILVVSLLSGPSVGVLGLPLDEPEVVLGAGSADIEITSAPDRGSLEPAQYADTGYVVSLPPATVDVSNLSGNPMVVYKLRIPELWYVTGTTHVLDERFTGRQTLTLKRSVLDQSSLEHGTYRGEILILKRVHEHDTVLYRANVTLQVEQ